MICVTRLQQAPNVTANTMPASDALCYRLQQAPNVAVNTMLASVAVLPFATGAECDGEHDAGL